MWFTPGQYAHFRFPFHIDDPHGKQHRTFTLTSMPNEPELRFIVRLDEPVSVYKRPLSELKPGDRMLMDDPLGDAVLPRLATRLLFVAQGIAIASYLSILKELKAKCARLDLAQEHALGLTWRSPVTLIWARRDADNSLENLIPAEIPNLKRVDIVYPARIDLTKLRHHVTKETLVYLSGSQSFVETLGTQLESSGTLRERIIYDYYEGYPDL